MSEDIEQGSLKSYILGFAISVILTLLAYFLVVNNLLSGIWLKASLGLLAVLQAALQLILFLNLNYKEKSRWNLIVFLFMILVVMILVFGSIWIISNLNYNMEMK